MKKTIIKILFIALLILTFASIAEAAIGIPEEYQPENTPLNIKTESPTADAATYTIFILKILSGALLYFAAPIAVILIVINALNMAKGGADSEALEQSKKGLTWTIVGLLVIILSYSIVRTVIKTTVAIGEGSEISTPATSP